ncbi:MAG: hypothetical protein G8D89_16285 [gamma proteobacterium symbiont of Clathrolucina costata]
MTILKKFFKSLMANDQDEGIDYSDMELTGDMSPAQMSIIHSLTEGD